MFLNPYMLLGLLAVAGPLVIHLWRRRQPRRVRWAAMRFLEAAVERHSRRRRVQDLLLLLMRCALVTLLAIALARPVFSGVFGRLAGARDVVLLVDASMSMQTRDGGGSRFDHARALASDYIDALPAGSRVSVIDVAAGRDPTIDPPTGDRERAKRKLEAMTPSDAGADLSAAAVRAIEMLRASAGGEVVILCDGGVGSLGDVATLIDAADAANERVVVRLITLGDPQPNVAITRLEAIDDIPIVGRPGHVAVTITNHGDSPVTDLRVALRLVDPNATAGTTPPVDEAIVPQLAAGQTTRVSLAVTPGDNAQTVLRATIPGDALPGDDVRSLVVTPRASVRVLLVDGVQSTRPSDASTFFLSRALGATDTAGTKPVFDVTRISSLELPRRPLDEVDVIVLADVPALDPSTAVQLAARVRAGMTLLVVAGEHIVPEAYNDLLQTQLDLLPARIGAKGGSDDEASATQLADRADHPVTRLWQDASAGRLSSVRVWQWHRLEPVAGANVIARLSAGEPVLVERSVGLGTVIVCGTTLDTRWTDLPLKAGVYVPLVSRLMSFAMAGGSESFTRVAGQSGTVRIAGVTAAPDRIAVEPPVGDVSSLHATSQGNQLRIDWPGAPRAGVHVLALESPTAVAVNADVAESAEKPMDASRRALLSSHVRLDDPSAIAGGSAAASAGSEWSLALLAIAAVLAAGELLLAHRMSGGGAR